MTNTDEINLYVPLDRDEVIVCMDGRIYISKSQKQEFKEKFESLINEYRI